MDKGRLIFKDYKYPHSYWCIYISIHADMCMTEVHYTYYIDIPFFYVHAISLTYNFSHLYNQIYMVCLHISFTIMFHVHVLSQELFLCLPLYH